MTHPRPKFDLAQPLPALVIFTLVLAAPHIPFLVMEWSNQQPFFSMRDAELEQMLAAVVSMCAVMYALYRVLTTHPVMQNSYYQWLRGTPWTSRHPLPLGPVRKTNSPFSTVMDRSRSA